MVKASLEDIQKDVAAFLERVEAGETVLIQRAGEPVAEVRPVAAPASGLRPYGLCKGEFTVPPDFDDPLPEEILQGFEGS